MEGNSNKQESIHSVQHLAPPDFRFTIVHLLYLTSLLAASIALFESYAALWLLGVVVFWLLWFSLPSPWFPRLLFLLFAILFLACFLLPVVPRARYREASPRIVCLNNARQLWLAMQNYASSHLAFPPACKSDGNDNKVSWRVQILPYLEQQTIYNQYDFSEPWDGPNNRKLVDQIGTNSPYFCPFQQDHKFKTPYKLVAGKGTAFEGGTGKPANQFQSMANTVAIIEDNANPVCWMEPKDLSLEEAVQQFDINQSQLPCQVIETKFYRRFHYHRTIVMFDGSSQSVGWLENPEDIIPYLMLNHPDKKEFNDLDFVYPKGKREVVLYSGFFLLGFNIFLAVLPCFWGRVHLSGIRMPEELPMQ